MDHLERHHYSTGAAVGYIPQDGFAVTFGHPLCEKTLVPRVIRSCLQFLEEHQLKPAWCCVSKPIENHLASEYEWRAVIAVAEERLSPTEVMPESNDKTVRRKFHRAEREGVKIIDVEVGHVERRSSHAATPISFEPRWGHLQTTSHQDDKQKLIVCKTCLGRK